MSLEKLLTDLIVDFVTNSESNRFSPDSEERIWDKPLVGFSKGDDPYYHFFKKDISERHTAFISGLGTFGLCDGLITAVGKAMRCGSVIIESVITPTLRQYKEYNEYCLYFSKGICMKCADRCPAGAINQYGHNKDKCREYQWNTITPFTSKEYNLESTCCGLCQVGVPCENCIPGRPM